MAKRYTIIAAALLVAAALGVYAYRVLTGGQHIEYTVHVLEARIGPVVHKLPGNKSVVVNVTIFYPDTLYLQGPPSKLGTINVTICTSWGGPWDGIVTVIVVDKGYRVDPTTFKPVEWEWRWAEGGAALGSGNLHAALNPVTTKCVNRSIEIVATERYLRLEPGVYEAQYFFKVRLSLFSPKTGEVAPGGIINLYTTSDAAPTVRLVKLPESRGPSTIDIVFYALVATALAAAVYALLLVTRR